MRQLIAQEDGDDGGRSFVCTEAMVVARGRYHGPQQTLELVYGTNDGGTEEQELGILVRRVARIEQVPLRGTAHGPVHVLA